MCVICGHLRVGIVEYYDAGIWLVELRNHIGERHYQEIKEFLDQNTKKNKHYEDLAEVSNYIDNHDGWID